MSQRSSALPSVMSAARLMVVNALISFVVLGSLACIALDREAWPFSHYPMYSWLYRGEVRNIRLYGLAANREVPLTEYHYWSPLGAHRAGGALGGLEDLPDGSLRASVALRQLAVRYEEQRLRGAHDGPPLSVLRVYEFAWKIQSRASNRGTPDSRRLIAEVQLND